MTKAQKAEVVADLRRFKRYPAYKDSGVEWLGEVPAHWEVKRLKHLAVLNPESLSEDTDPELEMVYVDIGGVDNLGRIVEKDMLTFGSAPSRARRIVKGGDVIVSTVRTYLRAIAPIRNLEPGTVVSTGFAVVRPAADLTTDYAAYTLRAPYFVERVVANSKGVSFPAINESEMATYELTLPPEPEQRTIAAFLDRETARIDAMVVKKERLIELLQEKRASLITQAVTKGLDPKAPMKDSGVEWLGEVPAHWEMRELRRLNRKGTSITYGIVQAGPDVEGGVPYIRTSDMAGDVLPRTGYQRAAREIDAAYQRSKVVTGDVVVAIRATVGKALPVPDYLEGANLTQGTAKVSPGERLNSRFLLVALQSRSSQQHFAALSKGATFREITLDMLRRFPIPVPPLAEQAAIVDFLDRETAQLDALITKIRTAIDRLKELRIALISAAVTGKIDVREEVD